MRLDLRYPLGLLFTTFGILLVSYGLVRPDDQAAMGAANINIYSGLPMLVFGVVMFWLARRAESSHKPGAGL